MAAEESGAKILPLARTEGGPLDELARLLARRFPPRAGNFDDEGQKALAVRHILRRLPVMEVRVLELRFLRGYSTAEIGREMRITTDAVLVMQLRALRAAATPGRAGPLVAERGLPAL